MVTTPELSSQQSSARAAGQKTVAHATGKPTVAVVGAGVCGLGIGWRLAEAGCRVAVFDKSQAGRGATWAAAGMLAANVECEPGEEGLLALTLASQKQWPAFARELTAASGIDLGYRDEGTLVAAMNRDEAEQLRNTFEFQRGLGLDIEWLSGLEARQREPYLKPGVPAAIYCRHDHQVDNRQLALALKTAFLRAGGQLHETSAVTELACKGGRVEGVVTGDALHKADVVVLAAGAWSPDLVGLPSESKPPVRPVKGQMLSLQMDPAAPLLNHVVWAPKIYLVPRNDGRLLVGATVEERGFDEALTAGGVFALLEAAWRAIPAVEELAIEEFWTGARPTSRDDAPILGPTGTDGLVVATGHHRNGILLAPITADLVSRFVLTGSLAPEAEAFTLARFRNQEPARRAVG